MPSSTDSYASPIQFLLSGSFIHPFYMYFYPSDRRTFSFILRNWWTSTTTATDFIIKEVGQRTWQIVERENDSGPTVQDTTEIKNKKKTGRFLFSRASLWPWLEEVVPLTLSFQEFSGSFKSLTIPLSDSLLP